MVNLKVKLPGLEMKNPVIPASGTFGFGYEFSCTIRKLFLLYNDSFIPQAIFRSHFTTTESIDKHLLLFFPLV